METQMQAHFFLLHLISGCLSVFNKLFRRSRSFVCSCVSHDSYLIRFVANYAVAHARSQLHTPLQFIFRLTSVTGLVRLII